MLRSDVERQRDYVAWADRMLEKGYFARAPVSGARQELDRLSHQLAVVEEEARVFRLFTAPKETRELESKIEGARATFEYQCARRKAHEDRLAALLKQAGKYTIRAPHDGMIVYPPIFEWMRRPLQPGVEVYQHEDILFLPDLSEIEVEVPYHETVAARVRVGMPADVRIAALPGRRFAGKVASIEMLPRSNYKGWDWTLQFFARVRLDRAPPGLLPFMSAEVRLDTGRVEDALVIPSGAMAVVGDRRCCYVLGPAGPERREITIGRSTPEFLEVTAGLREGERVVLDPGRDIPRATL
jgi:multidrug efflux pump subunit AcrA (membrane-fusion protein)